MNLLSPEYRAVIQATHQAQPQWGQGNKGVYAAELARQYDAATLLDYGCGKGGVVTYLNRETKIKAAGYDPGVPAYEQLPEPADLVICFDVMEHIEPECIDDVIAHIRSLALKVAVYKISTVLARSVLTDGRNAHISVYPEDWWRAKIPGAVLMRTPSMVTIAERRK